MASSQFTKAFSVLLAFALLTIYVNCSFKFESKLTIPINNLAYLAQCGYNEDPLISYSNGTATLWEKPVYNFSRPFYADCSLYAHELDEENRFVLLLPVLLKDTSSFNHILFRLKNSAFEPVSWTPLGTSYLANGMVGAKHILLITTPDEVVYYFSAYSNQDIKSSPEGSLTLSETPIKNVKLTGHMSDYVGKPFKDLKLMSDKTQYFFDSYGNFIEVDRSTGMFTIHYGPQLSLIKTFNPNNEASQKVYIENSTIDIGHYSSSSVESKYISFYETSDKKYFSKTIKITYSASTPKMHLTYNFNNNNNFAANDLTYEIGEWENLSEAEVYGNIYCQDRVFGTDLNKNCITDGGECVIDGYDGLGLVFCTLERSSGSAKFVVGHIDLTDVTNINLSLFIEEKGRGLLILFIILGVVAGIIIILAITFCVLRSKRGITFKQFITCNCGNKQSTDTDYGKLSN